MTSVPYIPSSGLVGKARRLSARLLARRAMAIGLDRPIVSFTFDDFPRSAARAGKDALERRGWRGTYFASACYAGAESHLGRMYDPEDLHLLLRDGHEIGCHTHSHLDAGRASVGEVLADVERNAAAMRAWGVAPAETFAYPYGETAPAIKTALAGRFRAMRSVHAGINRNGADRARLFAVGMEGGEARIAAAVAHAEAVAQRPGWLIFFGHDVQDDPSPWGCTPVQLERIVSAVAATGAEVLPVSAALDRLGEG